MYKKIMRRLALTVIGFVKYLPFTWALILRNFCYRIVLKKMGAKTNIADGVTILDPSKLSVGSNVSIHEYTIIGAGDITIGNYVMIAPNCSIISATHTFFRKDIPIKKQEVSMKKVVIGNDVWLGCGAIVLDGVKIGDGAVIGAGAVVTEDIPPYSIAMGIPCRVTRSR